QRHQYDGEGQAGKDNEGNALQREVAIEGRPEASWRGRWLRWWCGGRLRAPSVTCGHNDDDIRIGHGKPSPGQAVQEAARGAQLGLLPTRRDVGIIGSRLGCGSQDPRS